MRNPTSRLWGRQQTGSRHDLATWLRPDVLLVDIRMPGLDGVEVTRRLAGPDVTDPMAVVVITTFDLDEYVLGALRAGARGFLLKDAGPELLVQAIHAAANGDALIAQTSPADCWRPSPTRRRRYRSSLSTRSPSARRRCSRWWHGAGPTPIATELSSA